MSANFIDTALPRKDATQDPAPHTADLDMTATTDVHEESTTDLVDGSTRNRGSHEPVAAQHSGQDVNTPAVEPNLNTMPSLTAPPKIAPGTILCDRYILERPIGQGGTSLVYRARDIRRTDGSGADASVAIKLPLPDAKDPTRHAARLQHEYERARALAHPHIVRVFDLHRIEHEQGDLWLMTMELIEGKVLSTLLKERAATPVSLALKILRACAQALSYAHREHVVHGDFKPSNVFVTPDATVKIVDFGAAANSTEDPSRIPAATPAYASPEVLSGETPECRDDVFSLACVAYELLTGQHPFDRRSSIEARDAGWIPQRAWNLSTSQWLTLLSALSWRREQRPADVESFIAGLMDELSEVVIPESGALHEPQVNLQSDELPVEVMPRNRGWGFAAFAAAAVSLVFVAVQRPDDEAAAPATAPMTTAPMTATSQSAGIMASLPPTVRSSSELPVSSPATAPTQSFPEKSVATPEPVPDEESSQAAATKPRSAAPPPASRISLDSDSIVTSESSIAAVFVVTRSGSAKGQASVRWEARGISAEAETDFIVASGIIEFADGQTTRAVYIPLRDDQLAEGEETFKIALHSPQDARLGAVTEALATIKDDD